MQKFLIVLGLCLMLAISANAQSPKEAKPSFDCSKATTKVEKMICNDEGGELQKLDRLYSKLYFSILKSIPKNTKEGQNEREELKYFNHSVMSDRNVFQCYFIVPFGTGKQEDFRSNYCIKQIYLEAIATLAFRMIDSEANRKKWNFNQRVEKFNGAACPLEKYNEINFLSNYNLFNNFFENTTKGIVIDFMAYNIAQWNYFILQSRINEANSGEFDEAVKVYKILYEKLYQAFTEDKKLNKLLGN
ncbi:TPA: lysozyme inhibitor LprI family protein [Campylobacter jejuni]